ncbi:hypothetical protein ETD86_24790 [Nonomuraea turkmeniaca]|uniref:Exo-alpha-sialidase n=1 Tax=Nonomuraea turkmeniaca TaxID=103838 RepID=A0A5S4FDM8_9ACTN|nr:hypothetical protein [Nonomuraea turkmeniaca]TMR16604.1 hypothetical protein ETD86_24790 [Nonomuraea turkmeniaca]
MGPRLAAATLAMVVASAGCSVVSATGGEPSPGDRVSSRPSPADLPSAGTSHTPGAARPKGRWRVVYRQKGLDHDARFLDIAATGEADAWAVGERPFGTDGHEALLVRWDGEHWRRVTKELPKAARHVTLTKVDASDPGNVWVIAEDTEGGESGLLHFDGRRWSFTPHPASTSEEDPAGPSEVIALSGGQAWTFGDRWARHFDGRRWTSQSIPIVTHAAVALSPRDIWAVGEADPLPDDAYAQSEPAVAHFDGRAWQRMPLPALSLPDSSMSGLSAVLASTTDEVWAVGGYDTADGTFRPLSYRWNGTAWQAVAIEGGRLTGIARDSGGVMWVACRRFVSEGADGYRLLAGAGGRWSGVAPSAPVTAMTALPGGKPLWAIGQNAITEYRQPGEQ